MIAQLSQAGWGVACSSTCIYSQRTPAPRLSVSVPIITMTQYIGQNPKAPRCVTHERQDDHHLFTCQTGAHGREVSMYKARPLYPSHASCPSCSESSAACTSIKQGRRDCGPLHVGHQPWGERAERSACCICSPARITALDNLSRLASRLHLGASRIILAGATKLDARKGSRH